MQCPSCQRENPEASRFCNGCGASLGSGCPACGNENPSDAVFCNACGARLGDSAPATGQPSSASATGATPRRYTPQHLAERILRTRSALEGERKHVTVLFCDLADSTGVTERLGPEAMHEVMDRCFQLILERVHHFEGTVNQFLGDGAMALFGAPLALEDAPRRAVTAGLAIQRALVPLAAEVERRFGVPLRMRVGIHAGPVVVGRIGDDLRMDYTAVGDTTILANRLQELATAGSVLISEAVEHLVSGWFEVEDLGAVGVKGRTALVHAFAVTGERQVGGRIEARAEAGLTPLVGRTHELEVLERAFEKVVEGHGRVVFLVGEAGLGKSRLLYEFRRRLGERPYRWVEGRCASFATNAPFHSIVDGLRRGFAIDDRDDEAASLAKLESFEESIGGSLEWTLPFVRTILSLPSGDPAVDALDVVSRRSETFRALLARIQRSAELAPFVLAIEDLHWIDRASEEFLAYLSDALAASRVLLLLTHRPGYSHPFGDRSYHQRLSLQPLSREEMDQMADSVLEDQELPEALRALIASKAEGNPFFVEEVAHSLLEEGALRRTNGRIELARRVEDITVPDSIQDVLMARLDRLPDVPKHALQMASVVGREFALRLLARIVEAGDTLGPVIEELRALELIHEKTAHPEIAFMFKHALTRDVAYESVLVGRRKALHRVVGAAIEELYADRLAEHYGALAYHYGEGEDFEKAFLYSARAAEKASSAYANDSAAEYATRALALAGRLEAPAPDLLLDLERLLGAASFCLSRFQESGDAFCRAGELARDDERGIDFGRASQSYFWGHLWERSLASADRAVEEGRTHGLIDAEAYGTLMHGFDQVVRGRLDAYDRFVDQARSLEPKSDEVIVLLQYLTGQRAEWRGDYRAAVAAEARGVDIARKAHLPAYLIPGLWFQGKALCCLGEYDRALANLREAIDHSERIGDFAQRARMYNTLGWVLGEVGAHEAAAPWNRRGTELSLAMLERGLVAGAEEILANAAINLAGNHIEVGEPERAEEELASVRDAIRSGGDPWMRWRYRLHLEDIEARLLLARGEPERALECAVREVEGARRHDAAKLEARALELRGRALLAVGRRGEAEHALREALSVAERIGYVPARWRSLAGLGEVRRREGDSGAAAELFARGRRVAEGVADAMSDASLRRSLRAVAERLDEAAP